MKLYYSKGSCSLAIRILIHEIGMDCEFESVNLQTKKTETGIDFLTINFKGAVPALLTDDQEVITENSVIHQYLCDTYEKFELLPSVKDLKRYRVLEWLNYITTELHKSFSPLFNPNVPNEMKENIFKPILKRKLDFVDQHLSQNKFLVKDTYTAPDGYLFVMLSWLQKFNFQLSDFPNLKKYSDSLAKRPSIVKSLQEEKLI